MIIDCIETWAAQQSTAAEAHSGPITAQAGLVEGPVLYTNLNRCRSLVCWRAATMHKHWGVESPTSLRRIARYLHHQTYPCPAQVPVTGEHEVQPGGNRPATNVTAVLRHNLFRLLDDFFDDFFHHLLAFDFHASRPRQL